MIKDRIKGITYIGISRDDLNEEIITVICDRCGTKVDGIIYRSKINNMIQVTSGFYILDGYWGQFALNDEEKICDECMMKDLRYQNR